MRGSLMGMQKIIMRVMLGAGITLWLTTVAVADGKGESRIYERDGRWVEESTGRLAVNDRGQVQLRSDFGNVRVSAGASGEFSWRVEKIAERQSEPAARQLFRQFEVSVRGSRETVIVEGRSLRHARYPRLLVGYELKVPREFHVTVETNGGEIRLEELGGTVEATTAGGSITGTDLGGPARIETQGGDISLGNVGGELRCSTAGGSIRVGDVKGNAVLETSGGGIQVGRVSGDLRAETAGGSIRIAGADGDITAATAGGGIEVGESKGRLSAQTAGGNINITDSLGLVRAETAGGSIYLRRMLSGIRAQTSAGSIMAQILANAGSFEPSELETAFGDITVYLPAELPVTVQASIEMARGHKILTDFPMQIVSDRASYGPGEISGEGRLNGGGRLLRIRTVGGNIEIRKLSAELEQMKQQMQETLKQIPKLKQELKQRQRKMLRKLPSPPPKQDEY